MPRRKLPFSWKNRWVANSTLPRSGKTLQEAFPIKLKTRRGLTSCAFCQSWLHLHTIASIKTRCTCVTCTASSILMDLKQEINRYLSRAWTLFRKALWPLTTAKCLHSTEAVPWSSKATQLRSLGGIHSRRSLSSIRGWAPRCKLRVLSVSALIKRGPLLAFYKTLLRLWTCIEATSCLVVGRWATWWTTPSRKWWPINRVHRDIWRWWSLASLKQLSRLSASSAKLIFKIGYLESLAPYRHQIKSLSPTTLRAELKWQHRGSKGRSPA